MDYFNGCSTLDEIKDRYRKLAKQYHPDRNNGNTGEIMKDINSQYENAIDNVKCEEKNKKSQKKEADLYRDIINELLNELLNDEIDIEICGYWIWVTCPKKKKETIKNLKAAKFYWSNTKKKWYYRPEWYRSKSRGSWSMDEIQEKYGSSRIKKEKSKKYELTK